MTRKKGKREKGKKGKREKGKKGKREKGKKGKREKGKKGKRGRSPLTPDPHSHRGAFTTQPNDIKAAPGTYR